MERAEFFRILPIALSFPEKLRYERENRYMAEIMNKREEQRKNIGCFERIPEVRKIAVLRANALGDFLLALPALEALRAAYPAAEIVLLALAWHAQLLAERPSPIDRVVVIPPYGGVGKALEGSEDTAAIECFFAKMQQEHFDLAIQLHGGGGYSNPFVKRLNARLTIGMRTPEAEPLDRQVPYIYYQSEIMRFLEVVSLVGASPVVLEPRLMIIERDLTEAIHVVPEDERPLVVLHPGASDSRRHWPVENFAAVGDTLAEGGARIVITGTKEESAIVAEVRKAMRTEALDLSGHLSLSGLTGLLARCAVMISNDTGPMHLASAVGTPTVGLYWVGNLITAGHPTRTRHRPVISWQLACPVCGQNNIQTRCLHQVSFISSISTGEVIATAQEFLSVEADDR
jgi:ADP-heptose:LPS heptosyltransferase